jgi:hypothetical protein
VKYRLVEPSAHAPWHASIRIHVRELVGTDDLGDLVLDLLTRSLAPITYNNYGTGMQRFTVFCNEEGINPLEATAADMLCFTAWLARAGTVAANSLQPYFSAINKLFRNHHKELVAMGPLLPDGRRGLAMQQPITDPDILVPILAPIVQLKLKLKLFTTCTVCAGLQQLQYAPVAVSGPSQLCHEAYKSGLDR